MNMNYRSVLKIIAAFILFYAVHVSGEPFCEDLPIIKNGRLILSDKNSTFNINESIPYTCDEDFRTDEANPKVICILKENIATWSESACKAIVISCHHPGYLENADLDGNIFTFPNNITYKCKEGFRMKGHATKYCSRSGQWQPPSMPYCEAILCPILNHPQNGKVLDSNRRPSSVAAYKCDRYYKLVGDSERVCLADGSWSGSNPTCEKITCKAPEKFPNGRIVGVQVPVYNASDIIIFQCNDGIHMSSKCLENGEWSARPPVCSGTILTEATVIPTTISFNGSDIDEIKGTTVIETSVNPSTVSSKGNESDEIKGTTVIEPSVNPTIISSKDGDSDEIKGKVDSCEDPGKINNGDRSFTTLHINSTVTYTCDEGYQLRGKSTLLCMENGKWNLDKLPICVKPLSMAVQTVVGIVFGIVILICIIVGGYFYYRYKLKSIRGYGEKSKALTADATDIEEITGLERDKKHIPVTVL